MATRELPSVVWIIILDHLSWTDISKFVCNILFDEYHPILYSDAFLLLLCQRDLYCHSFESVPPLSIPMQIYIYSRLIVRLQPHSCSRFTAQCSPLINQRQSIIFCFEELIRIFVEDQCHEKGQHNKPLSNAMSRAFQNSKSVRIGWTKIILSHPMCVFWYYRPRRERGLAPFDGFTIHHRDQCDAASNRWDSSYYEVNDLLSFLQQRSKVTFVQKWRTEVDYIWHALEQKGTSSYYYEGRYHYLMLFEDNVDGTEQCGLFVTNIDQDKTHYDTRNRDGGCLYFDRDTPWTEFANLFVMKQPPDSYVREYFEFVHPPYSYDLPPFTWPDTDERLKIDRTLNPLHCLQYFYPLVRDR